MGIEVLRSNNSRCPPFLVGGLLILSLFLLCNWWSLSSQNLELLKQIDNLADQLRANGIELKKCAEEKLLIDEKLKDSQSRFVQQQIAIDQAKDSENELREKYKNTENDLKDSRTNVESLQKNLDMCHTEMESLKKLSESKDKTLETFKADKESLKSEIVQKNKKIEELNEKILELQKNTNPLSKNKLIQSMVKNLDANNKKAQEVEGDSGLLSLDNDPREEEMREG